MNLYRIETIDGRATLAHVDPPTIKGITEPIHLAAEASRRCGATVLLIEDGDDDKPARVKAVVNHHGKYGHTLHDTDYSHKVPNDDAED